MLTPIALQLYTVREALAKDFNGVVRRVAEMGYLGVEPAGFPGTTPQQAAQLFKDLGLQVTSIHNSQLLGDQKQEALDTAAAVGAQTIVIPSMPRERFHSADDIKKVCDELNAANVLARQNHFTLAYHNHEFEFAAVDGKLGHDWMKQSLDPSIQFELDVYWIRAAGIDPAQIVKTLGNRAPLLHIKDGPAVRGQPMVALGEGIIDLPDVVQAGNGHTAWLIVELDQCATDMMTAVEKSYRYLVEKGLGRGKAS